MEQAVAKVEKNCHRRTHTHTHTFTDRHTAHSTHKNACTTCNYIFSNIVRFTMRFDFSYFCLDGNSEGGFVCRYEHFSISIFTVCFSLLFRLCRCLYIVLLFVLSFFAFFLPIIIVVVVIVVAAALFPFLAAVCVLNVVRCERQERQQQRQSVTVSLLSSTMSNNKVNTMINNNT